MGALRHGGVRTAQTISTSQIARYRGQPSTAWANVGEKTAIKTIATIRPASHHSRTPAGCGVRTGEEAGLRLILPPGRLQQEEHHAAGDHNNGYGGDHHRLTVPREDG